MLLAARGGISAGCFFCGLRIGDASGKTERTKVGGAVLCNKKILQIFLV